MNSAPQPDDDDIQKYLERLSRVEGNTKADTANIYEQKYSGTKARWSIAVFVIGVWIFVVAAATFFLIFGGSYATVERVDQIMELIKVALLPVVTFVIGHYFGSKSDS